MTRIIFSLFAFLLSTSQLAQTPSSAEWTTYGKKMTASSVTIEKGGAISKEQQDIIDGKKKKDGHDEKH